MVNLLHTFHEEEFSLFMLSGVVLYPVFFITGFFNYDNVAILSIISVDVWFNLNRLLFNCAFNHIIDYVL